MQVLGMVKPCLYSSLVSIIAHGAHVFSEDTAKLQVADGAGGGREGLRRRHGQLGAAQGRRQHTQHLELYDHRPQQGEYLTHNKNQCRDTVGATSPREKQEAVQRHCGSPPPITWFGGKKVGERDPAPVENEEDDTPSPVENMLKTMEHLAVSNHQGATPLRDVKSPTKNAQLFDQNFSVKSRGVGLRIVCGFEFCSVSMERNLSEKLGVCCTW